MNLKNNWAILLFFWINTALFAGENPFDISYINPLLLIKAHSVVRYDNTVIKIQNIDKVVENCQKEMTILNKKGDNFAQIYIHTNKMKFVSSFKAVIYNEKGKIVKTFHKSDLIDMAMSTSSLTLIDEDRVKILSYESSTYPYTIEYEYVNQFIFNIPETYAIEALPKNQTETHDFADFSITYTQKGQQIIVNSILKLKRGAFPAKSYQDLIHISKLVQSSESQKAVLIVK